MKNAYNEFLQSLKNIYSDNEAAEITGWVFESVVGVKRSGMISNPKRELTTALNKRIASCLSELLLHKPVQYVLGESWFYKMKLKVNEHVLIPRPETEELVELVVSSWQPAVGGRQTVLDIGTGSGCIAIAIKKLLPQINITAIDVSEAALNVAMENATAQSTAIDFKTLDFLNETNWADLPKYDTIVSNPPYIPVSEKEMLDMNVTEWEPHMALFVPDNSPLLFYEKIAAFGKTHLNNGGKIFVELHEQYAQQTAAMFRLYYENAVIKKDIYGKERMLVSY